MDFLEGYEKKFPKCGVFVGMASVGSAFDG